MELNEIVTFVEMKDKMSDISATPSAVIASVVTQLEPDVLMALPKNKPLKGL